MKGMFEMLLPSKFVLLHLRKHVLLTVSLSLEKQYFYLKYEANEIL